MAMLSISAAWNETSTFVRSNVGALFTIAFALVALPSVLLQALLPQAGAPGATPEIGLWLLLMPVVIVLTIAGTVAISALALDRENVVGRAIALGFRRALPLLGATLLVGLAALVVMIPLILLIGVAPEDLASGNSEGTGAVALAILLFMLIFMFVWVRLMLMTPAAAAETGGPLAILRRSWDLTRGRFWKLFGMAILLVIVALVVMLAVTAVVGILIALVAGAPQPGNLSSVLLLLLGGVLNAVFVVYFTTILARIYLQLAGPSTTGS